VCHTYFTIKDELNLIKLAQKYSDEDKARELMESLLWPNGPVCPHCKNHTEKPIYRLQSKATSKTKVRKDALTALLKTPPPKNGNKP
jgi:hypothetical protein